MGGRIRRDSAPEDWVRDMSEGNWGASKVLRMLVEKMNPNDVCSPESMCATVTMGGLDCEGIYGSRIWALYKDVCGEDLRKLQACVIGVAAGAISAEALNGAIDGTSSLDTKNIVATVNKKIQETGNLYPVIPTDSTTLRSEKKTARHFKL